MGDYLHRLITHNRIVGHVMATVDQEALGELAAGIIVNRAGIANGQYPTTNSLDLGIGIGAVTNMTHGAILSFGIFYTKPQIPLHLVG
jgi:hypothetical protein